MSEGFILDLGAYGMLGLDLQPISQDTTMEDALAEWRQEVMAQHDQPSRDLTDQLGLPGPPLGIHLKAIHIQDLELVDEILDGES